jgi:hypothetical protein
MKIRFALQSVRLLLAILTICLAHGSATAAQFTNGISKIKFTEQLKRTVKFVHGGPFVGHYTLLNDRGSYTLDATLDITGIDPASIDNQTLLTFGFAVGEDEEPIWTRSIRLGSDSKFDEGDTSATTRRTEEFDDKNPVVETIKLKLNPILETARLRVTGKNFAATLGPGTQLEAAGDWIFAGTELATISHEINETVFFVMILQTLGGNSVVGIAPVTLGGRVKSTPKTDEEIGTYNASIVAIAGVGNN